MVELKSCPFCKVPPEIGYVCGEYFIYGENDNCPYCGLSFSEMHSSEEAQINAWNRRISNVK